MSRKMKRRPGTLTALVAVPLLACGLAACAPSTADATKTTPPRSSQQAEAASDTPRAQWRLDFAKCMRAAGFDVPDPDESGTLLSVPSGANAEAFEEATKACRTELGEPPAVTADEEKAANAEFIKWGRKVAACYRDQGYDMPDPTAGQQLAFPADAPLEVQEECSGHGDAGTEK